MNSISIRDLYTGKPDAKDEINFDGLEGFINTFVVPTNFNIDDIVCGNKLYITGYKGTGKTALLFYLDSYLKQKDESTCSSFIFFKEEFTDARKSELEIISRRILNSVSIAGDALVNSTDFEYIWRWIFFKRVVSDNEEYNNQLFLENSEWNEFKKIIDKIKDPSNSKKIMIPEKLKMSIPYKDPTTLIETGLEVEVDFKKNQTDLRYQQFINLIDDAEISFLKLTRTDIPYYIFVDELEAYYGDKDIFRRDLYLIRDLIFTIKRFYSLLFQIDNKKTKIICSVRSEIIKAITRFIVSKEMNKIIGGFEVPLIWDYNNTTSYSHPIMQILLKRIGTCENGAMYDNKDVYQRWFPEKIHDIEPANYVLNNSWFKPRDIVRLLLSVKHSINNNSTVINQAVFDGCLKQYSADCLAEITEEMRALYSSEQIDCIVSCFTGFRSNFSVMQLKTRIENHFKNSILDTNFTEVINDLYRLGFLGNYLPLAKTYRWQHKGNTGVILSDEWRIMIHQALQSALSVGSRNDYGLQGNNPPQVGDVVTAVVKNIKERFVFVDFKKNDKSYNGVIHISELGYSFISKLSDVVNENDEFKAVILSYNDEFKNWSLSKRKVVLIDK